MAARSACSSSVPTLPPPSPKSPPEYPDLYGKRRDLAMIQMLEREIGFLQEELKSVQGIRPVSVCCKEINDFVITKSDPLTPTCKTKHQGCHFWKWLCGFPCFNLSWICCCFAGCTVFLEAPHCCDCKPCKFQSWVSCCRVPKGSLFSLPPGSYCCCRNISCSRMCCTLSLPSISCPGCRSCCECKCSCKCAFPKCPQLSSCFCTKTCCNPC